MQINNLKISYSRKYKKWQVSVKSGVLYGVILEEFETEEQAIEYARKTKDFIKRKQVQL